MSDTQVRLTTARGTEVIACRGLSKFYGHVRALEDVDFDLVAGEVHALVGDNGAGKSTLVKIIAGAIQPTAGEILIDGRVRHFSTPRDALAHGIATVHQNLALVGCRTITANLFLGRELTRFGFLRQRRMNAEALEMLSALRQMNVHDPDIEVSNLSGGQRQAVAIARGLRLGTRVLILDEPTAALGVRESEEVLNLIARLKGTQRAILIVSHNLAHVFRIADRITVLRSGHRIGTVDQEASTPNEIVKMITGADLL